MSTVATTEPGSRPTTTTEPTNGKAKTNISELVGSLVAKRAVGQGISQVVFDRGGYKYHGRVKALAEAARQAGLKF